MKDKIFELKFCEQCYQMTNHIGDVCQKCKSHPTHEISEEEIEEVFHNEYGTHEDENYAIEYDAFNAGFKAALSKGAKPMSEERIEELWNKHCYKYRLEGDSMDKDEFKAALKELNR